MELIPAILPSSREDAENKIARLASAGFGGAVQLDAVDGRFAAPACWPLRSGDAFPQELPGLGRFTLDADLMVADPLAFAGRYAAAGATRLTIHAESVHDLGALLARLSARLGHEKDFAPGLVSIGLALSIETPLALLEPYAGEIDYVQLMGIAKIGAQGELFDERVLARVRELHKKHPELPIQVDGGVSLRSAPELLKAGAARLVVGSALFGAPDLKAELHKFEMLSLY